MSFSSKQAHQHLLLGAVFAFIAAVAFSGKAILVKLAYRYAVDPVTLLTLRMLFSVPFFMVMAIWSARDARTVNLNRRDWSAIVILGLLGYYLGSLLDFWGLSYISASLERLTLFLYPTLVVLLSAFLLHRRIRSQEILALILSYTGIVLVFIHDLIFAQGNVILGSGLVFGSALAYAIYLIGSGKTIAKIGAIRFTAYSMIVASIAVFAQFGLSHPSYTLALSALDFPVAVYYLSFLMALLSTVLPAFLIVEALRRIGASKTAIVGTIGPVSTLIFSALFLGEPISVIQLIGASLVISGVLWISLSKATGEVVHG